MLGIVLFTLFAALAEASDLDIAIIPAAYDLGQVGHDDRILGAAEIANRGHKPVTIRSVRSNCGCYKVSCPPRDLLPGESATVEFDLTFPRGKELHNPVIYVLTDDKEKPMRTLQMKMSLTEERVPSRVSTPKNNWILDTIYRMGRMARRSLCSPTSFAGLRPSPEGLPLRVCVEGRA